MRKPKPRPKPKPKPPIEPIVKVDEPPPPEKICGTCRFFLAGSDITVGVCRRYPPRLVMRDYPIYSIFPPTQASGWCGEYQAVNPIR